VVGRSSGDLPHCAKTAFFPEMETEMVKSEKFCENPERKITKLTCCNAKKNHQDTKRIFYSYLF